MSVLFSRSAHLRTLRELATQRCSRCRFLSTTTQPWGDVNQQAQKRAIRQDEAEPEHDRYYMQRLEALKKRGSGDLSWCYPRFCLPAPDALNLVIPFFRDKYDGDKLQRGEVIRSARIQIRGESFRPFKQLRRSLIFLQEE